MKKIKFITLSLLVAVLIAGFGIFIPSNQPTTVAAAESTSIVNDKAFEAGADVLLEPWDTATKEFLKRVRIIRFEDYGYAENLGEIQSQLNLGTNIEAYFNTSNSQLTILPTIAEAQIYAPQDATQMFNPWTNGVDSVTSPFTEIYFTNFNTSLVTTFWGFFDKCTALKIADVSTFNTSNATSMRRMFRSNSSRTELNVSNFDTSNVTDMGAMFETNSKVTSLDVSNFDTSKVTVMGYMFNGMSLLESLDVSSFDTSLVGTDPSTITVDMAYMFGHTKSLTLLDLSSFDLSNINSSSTMLYGTTLSVLYTPYSIKSTKTITVPNGLYINEVPIATINSQLLNNGSIVLKGLTTSTISFDTVLGGVTNPKDIILSSTETTSVIMPSALSSVSGKFFLGWSQSATETDETKIYLPNQSVVIESKDTTFYAIWIDAAIPVALSDAETLNTFELYHNANLANSVHETFTYKLTATNTGTFTGFSVYSPKLKRYISLGTGTNVSEGKYELEFNATPEFLRDYVDILSASSTEIRFLAEYANATSQIRILEEINDGSDVSLAGTVYIDGIAQTSKILPEGNTTTIKIVANPFYQIVWFNGSAVTPTNQIEESLQVIIPTELTVRYEKIDIAVNITAITTSNASIVKGDVILTNNNTSFVIGDSLSAETLTTSFNYEFVKWTYANGDLFGTDFNLNSYTLTENVLINATTSDLSGNLTLNLVAVFEFKYALKVNVHSNGTAKINYNENINISASLDIPTGQTFYIYETQSATITVTPSTGYQLSTTGLSELSSYSISGNTINIYPVLSDNVSQGVRIINISFTSAKYAINIVNQDQNGNMLYSINDNFNMSVSAAGNLVDAGNINDVTANVSIMLNGVTSADEYKFSKVYLANAQLGTKVLHSQEEYNNGDFEVLFELSQYVGYSIPAANNVYELNIIIEYIPQAVLNMSVENADMANNYVIEYLNETGEFEVVSGEKIVLDLGATVKVSLTPKNYREIVSTSGITKNMLLNGTTFVLDSKTNNIAIALDVISYNVISSQSNSSSGVLPTYNGKVAVGETISITFTPTASYEILDWSVKGISDSQITRQGNTISFVVTEEFLNNYLTNDGLTIDNTIETVMNGGILAGIIGGSAFAVILSIVIVLVLLKNKKSKAEKAAIQAKLDAVSKKFNISNVIADLKAEAKEAKNNDKK